MKSVFKNVCTILIISVLLSMVVFLKPVYAASINNDTVNKTVTMSDIDYTMIFDYNGKAKIQVCHMHREHRSDTVYTVKIDGGDNNMAMMAFY